jgi:hypothetical protein
MDTPRTSLLQGLPFLARLGATGFLFAAALGLYASLRQIQHHHGKNDGVPELSYTDVVGAYHGVNLPSPMRSALEGSLAGHEGLVFEAGEREALLAWLDDGRAAEVFDDIDRGDMAPIEIFARRCDSCHTDGGAAAAFDSFASVKPLLSDKQLVPTPADIVWTSLHTHAPAMFSYGFVLCLAALLTRHGRVLRSLPLALAGLGVALDVGSWIPARDFGFLVPAIVTGGALFSAGCALAIVVVLHDVWWPARRI